jgi:predicted nucleic acid-binding protein
MCLELDAAIAPGADLLLDTTALIAYLEGGQSVSAVTGHIMDVYVKSGRNRALVPTMAAMELLVKPVVHGADANVLAFLTNTPNLEVVDIDLSIAHEAAKLRAHRGFRPPDALIVATGIMTRADFLVTNDVAWKKKFIDVASPIVVLLADFSSQ